MTEQPTFRPDDEAIVAAALRAAFAEPADELARRRTERTLVDALSASGAGVASTTKTLRDVAGSPAARAASRLSRHAAAVLIALVAMASGSTGMAAASSTSLPGEVLYPVKQIVERVWMTVSPGQVRSAQLELRFAERRLHEITDLKARGGDTDRLAGLWEAFDRHIAAAEALAGERLAEEIAALRATAEEIRGTGVRAPATPDAPAESSKAEAEVETRATEPVTRADAQPTVPEEDTSTRTEPETIPPASPPKPAPSAEQSVPPATPTPTPSPSPSPSPEPPPDPTEAQTPPAQGSGAPAEPAPEPGGEQPEPPRDGSPAASGPLPEEPPEEDSTAPPPSEEPTG